LVGGLSVRPARPDRSSTRTARQAGLERPDPRRRRCRPQEPARNDNRAGRQGRGAM